MQLLISFLRHTFREFDKKHYLNTILKWHGFDLNILLFPLRPKEVYRDKERERERD